MNDVKWLLVGPGDIARKRVADALTAAEHSAIEGIVYHSRREQAEELAQRYNASAVYDDFRTALEKTDANAVYLATPVGLHVSQAVAALQAGRHVLVEKPLALTADEAGPLIEEAERSGLRAGCAYYRRFFPRFDHARGLLRDGALGRIVLVRIVFHSWFHPAPDDPKHWRVLGSRSGGGALADMGCHLLDLMVGMVGLPVSVFAYCDNLVHPNWDVEDSTSALMKLENGAHVTLSASWNSKTWRQELEIVGTEGRLSWLPTDTGPVTVTRGRETESIDLANAENVHLPLVQDFVDAVREQRDPLVTVAEAVKTNRVLDAMYRSAEGNRGVMVSG